MALFKDLTIDDQNNSVDNEEIENPIDNKNSTILLEEECPEVFSKSIQMEDRESEIRVHLPKDEALKNEPDDIIVKEKKDS